MIAAASFINGGNLGWVLAVLFLATGGYFTLRGQSKSGKDSASITTVTMMSGQIAALTSENELNKTRIDHLEQQLADKDKALTRNERDIETLREALTQRAEVEEFRIECMDWFGLIGKRMEIDPPPARPKTKSGKATWS